jgi:outer membrane protein
MIRKLLVPAMLLAVAVPAAAQDAGREYTLERALRAALSTNELIGQVEQEVEKSRLLRRQAWMTVIPSASFSTNIIRNDTAKTLEIDIPGFETPSEGGFTIQPLYDYSLSLNAQQMVYLGGRIWKALDLAKTNVGLAEDLFNQAKRDLLLQVCVAYSLVEKAQRNLQISREALELAASQLRQAEVLFRAGETVRTSVLRAESLKVQAERQVIFAETVLDKAKEDLTVLTGIEPPYSVKPMERPDIPTEDLEQLIDIGFRTRVELDANEKQIRMTELLKGIAFGEKLPTVALAFNYTKQRAAFPSDQFWRMVLSVSVPIYDGGASDIKRAQAEADRRKLLLEKSLKTKEIRAEITQAYLDYVAIRKSLESARKELELVEQTYEDISRFYAVGEATDLDRENAFQQLNTVKRTIANLETDEVLALLVLRRSLGLPVMDLAEE